MRSLIFVSLVTISGTLLALSGCGGGVTNSTTNGGDGGTTAAGGQGGAGGDGGSVGPGGASCQPETEICDGKDNNCNTIVDDVPDLPQGCSCNVGTTQPCYSGAAGTEGVGTCKPGTQTCVGGMWAECTGQITPGAAEECDGLDDNCNGTVDDLGALSCGVGACMTNIPKCIAGQTQTCLPGQPSAEVCDGIDNNCNGLKDESDPMTGASCLSGQPGVCSIGKLACQAGMLDCVPNEVATTESCDGLDNDCNGMVDDDVPGTGLSCDSGLPGPCLAGLTECQGTDIGCASIVAPVAETCDNVDNDCNGVVDDPPGANDFCDTGLLGACQAGLLLCQGTSLNCVQQVQAVATDVCGDNVDNDCNGTVDPGCLYTAVGVQTNVPIAQLNGWTQCYMDSYSNFTTPITTILAQCNKPKLLMGCRVNGSNTLLVAAHAPRVDVIFDTGTSNVLHNANGVGWYFNNNYSWGFAPQGNVVERNSCDVEATDFQPGLNPDKRICWHTGSGNINDGWRCGASHSISSTHQRLLFHAD